MKKRWIVAGTALAAATWLALGVGGLPGHTEGAGTTVTAGEYEVEFVSGDSAGFEAMKPAEFVLSVRDREGNPVSGATLSVVLSMPNMFCGQFQAAVSEERPGVYRATAVPVMRGKWQAKLRLEEDGGEETFVHRFKVV